MSRRPEDTCAFCHEQEENSKTGKLQRMPDGGIVAHYNCMLYSPRVISKDSQEDMEGFDFKIKSVLCEIKRGKKLRCNYCKKQGATVGCDVKSCRKNYHYPCVEKAKGSPSLHKYVVYCAMHKTEETAEGCNSDDDTDTTSSSDDAIGTSTQHIQDIMATEDVLKNVDTDTTSRSDDSEICKTPGRLPDINVHVNPSRCSTEEKHFTGEQPVSSCDEKLPGKIVHDVISELMSALDESACSVNNMDTSELSKDTIGPKTYYETPITQYRRVPHRLGLLNDRRVPTQQIHSTNSVSDASPEKMEKDLSASQLFNRETPPVATSSNVNTLQNETNGQNIATMSNIVSPQQITAVSRTVDPIKQKDLVCWERSKSIKRKLPQDSEELGPNMNLQQTEGNLPEQPEIPEEQNEYNFRESALRQEVAMPGSIECEPAYEHQSGPSRMATPCRRRLHGPFRRGKSRLGFQYEKVGDVDFGSKVADACRRLPHDRQAKYMSYVLASAHFFHTCPTLPEHNLLLTNLWTVLERSQQLTP